MPATESARRAAKRRVITLMNAISDLHHGDLLTVLQLVPLEEFGPEDTFEVKEGKLIHTPGPTPPPKSLISRIRTGEALARILEQHLVEVMAQGQVVLRTTKKSKRGQLGGRTFCDDEEGD